MLFTLSVSTLPPARGTIRPGTEVWTAYRLAERYRRTRTDNGVAMTVCGVAARLDQTLEQAGRLTLTVEAEVFPVGVVYGISTVRLVPPEERGLTLRMSADEAGKFRGLMSEFSAPQVGDWSLLDNEDINPAFEALRRARDRAEEDFFGDTLLVSAEGFTPTPEEAAGYVGRNSLDMSDQGWCQYAVVEELVAGMWPDSTGEGQRQFWKWKPVSGETDRGHYESLDAPPPEFENDRVMSYWFGARKQEKRG
jgi:hypothetical protein